MHFVLFHFPVSDDSEGSHAPDRDGARVVAVIPAEHDGDRGLLPG